METIVDCVSWVCVTYQIEVHHHYPLLTENGLNFGEEEVSAAKYRLICNKKLFKVQKHFHEKLSAWLGNLDPVSSNKDDYKLSNCGLTYQKCGYKRGLFLILCQTYHDANKSCYILRINIINYKSNLVTNITCSCMILWHCWQDCITWQQLINFSFAWKHCQYTTVTASIKKEQRQPQQ